MTLSYIGTHIIFTFHFSAYTTISPCYLMFVSQISSSSTVSAVDLSESSPEVKVTRASITLDDSFNVCSISSVRLIEVVGYGERYGDIANQMFRMNQKL